jgi:hypothetical protein
MINPFDVTRDSERNIIDFGMAMSLRQSTENLNKIKDYIEQNFNKFEGARDAIIILSFASNQVGITLNIREEMALIDWIEREFF